MKMLLVNYGISSLYTTIDGVVLKSKVFEIREYIMQKTLSNIRAIKKELL
jgi:hypothetical protein